jgi:hypothetical protein
MKVNKIIIILSFFISLPMFAQHSELGLMLGTSYYIGDINPSIHVVNKVRPAVGVFYRKNSNKRYSLRGGVNYAMLSASDAATGHQLNEYRDLSFSANLFEGYGILEFNFIPYQINNYNTSNFTPYVFIGVSVFLADINVDEKVRNSIKDDDKIEDLAAPAIPFGFGIKFNLIENFGLGIEWGLRKTFTDKIDGLPEFYENDFQLSNAQNNDWYGIVGVTLNYKFLTKRDNCPGVIN